jgi:hypothetical protein
VGLESDNEQSRYYDENIGGDSNESQDLDYSLM